MKMATGAVNSMADAADITPRLGRWGKEFDRLLASVQGCGAHGQLIDVRVPLRAAVNAARPLVMLCPHADDGAITAACLLHEYAVKRTLPVVEVLVFAGERNVAAPWLNDQKKVSVREGEFRLECSVLGAESVCWNLDAYRSPGYRPSNADLDKIVAWFQERRPGAIILPPATDAHVAHRMTRALAAVGLLGAELHDTLVLTGWTPWGPLPQPNAYFAYDGEAERTKEWAIHCHPSQVLLTDYTKYCTHLGRAYAALTREWAEGHTLGDRPARQVEDRFIGVELFQIENPEPAGQASPDPIRSALALLASSAAATATAPLSIAPVA